MVLTDLRFSGGTSTSLIDELSAATAGGYRTGIIHLSSNRLGPSAAVHPGLRRQLDDGATILILPGEPVSARLAIVKHPSLFADWGDDRLAVYAERAVITVGQVPADHAGSYYDPVRVDRNVTAALGVTPVWAPVSPVVRAVLSAISDEIVITDEDWVEVIDPSEWRERDGRDNDEHHVTVGPMDTRPIIGRHSRPDPKKWPADADEIRQAYPINGEVRVRVLGGAEAMVETLGAVPAAWEVLPYGSLPAAEFLAGLDAYVYFHHRDLTEAFGRSILEALAARVPVVVAPHFEPLFGEACLYASPSTASDTVRALLADPDELQRHLDRADEIVATRFSHAVHQTRLARMAGPPGELFGDSKRSDSPAGRAAPAFALIPAAQRRAHTTTLIACLGAPLERVESLLGQLDKHRRRAPGFIPILVVTLSVPPLARELGLETRVITSRRSFSSDTEDWDDYAVRRLRQLAMHYRVDNVAAAGFDDADAWIALQCRRRDARVDP